MLCIVNGLHAALMSQQATYVHYECESTSTTSPDMAADNKADASKYAQDVHLINAVREFPLLYDPTARNYRDPEVVAEAWKQIATAICAKGEWTECKERWRKLRDAYVKVKKGLAYGNKKPITWVHYEDMSFLSEHIKHRGNEKKVKKRSLGVEDEMSAEVLGEESQAGTSTSSRRREAKRARKVDPMQVTIVEALSQGVNAPKMPTTDLILDDEEGLFGRMVAATLRRFPPRAKARCKFRIQEIIFQQENENLGGAL